MSTSTISGENSELPDLCCGCEISDVPNIDDRLGCNKSAADAQQPDGEPEQAAIDFFPTTTTFETAPMTPPSRSNKKIKSAKQTIRAFSLKKSFASFRSQDSFEDTYSGYDDPNLFVAVSERMKRTTPSNERSSLASFGLERNTI